MMNFIRWILGRIILGVSALTMPKKPVLSPAQQQQLDALTKNLSLYQYAACPFCVKVRRAIRRMGMNIEIRDAKNDPHWRNELATEGGKQQAPCLRIEENGNVTWLYESGDIISYLKNLTAQESLG